MTLDGTASTDDQWDMAGLKFLWRMGDGGVVHSAEGQYSYAMEGMYTVTLEVTDGDGDTGSWSTQVTVLPPQDTDGPNGDDGISMVVVGGGVALVVIVLLVLLFVIPMVRRGTGPDDESQVGDGRVVVPDDAVEQRVGAIGMLKILIQLRHPQGLVTVFAVIGILVFAVFKLAM